MGCFVSTVSKVKVIAEAQVTQKELSVLGQVHLLADSDYFQSEYVLKYCNGNTRGWVRLALDMAKKMSASKSTSADVKNFPKKDPNKAHVVKYGIRFLKHDSALPEDSYDFTGTLVNAVTNGLNSIHDTDNISFFPDRFAASQSILQTFARGSLPVTEVTWANWETEQTFSNLVFYGLGQYYLSAAVKGTGKPESAVFEVDLSALSAYAVRPGFEAYGAIAYFNSSKKCCGIMWSSKKRLVLPTDPDFQRAALVFRSTLIAICTVKEHLAHTHWIISNGLVNSSERFLSPTHPIRRFVKPHTFNAVAVNALSLPALSEYRGIAGRSLAGTIFVFCFAFFFPCKWFSWKE